MNKLSLHNKNTINAFLQLHFDSIDKSVDLANFDLKPYKFNKIDLTDYTFTSKFKSNRLLKTELVHKKHLLQTSKSAVILSCVQSNDITIQSEKYRNKLRYFWTKWESQIQPMMFIKNRNTLNEDILERFFATNNKADLQFFFISFAKLHELIRVNKFDSAYFLLKGIEQKGIKNGRFLSDMALYVNVSKCTNELDFTIPRMGQKLKNNLEKKVVDAKAFFTHHKNFGEIPGVIFRAVLAFLLSVEEYEFVRGLNTQESVPTQNINHNKKQRVENKNGNVCLMEVRNFSY